MDIKQDKIKKNIFSGSLKYIDDYKTDVYTDEKGRKRKKVTYIGPYAYIRESDKSYITKLVLLYVFAALLVVFEFMAMITPIHATGGFLGCALPIVTSYLPLMFLIAGLLALPIKEKKLKRDQYFHGLIRVFKCAAAILVLLAVAIIAGIIYRIVKQDFMFIHGDLLYTVSMALSLLFAALVIIVARQIKINDIEIVKAQK